MKKILLMFLSLLCTVGVLQAETAYKTLTFSAANNEKGVSGYDNSWACTVGGFTWNMVNWNNNNNQWAYVKCGSKSAASVGTVTTAEAIDASIGKVTITVGAITAANVNSIKLYTSATNDFSNPIETLEFNKAQGEQTVELASPAANLYYQIAVDCVKKANGCFQLNKVEYFAAAGQEVTPTVATPTFTPAAGEYAKNTEISINCATEGAAIYYTINGGATQTYSGPISLTEAMTIVAHATKADCNDSAEATAAYTVRQEIDGAVTDVITYTSLGMTASTYTDFSNKSFASDAKYAINCGGTNNSVQLRSSNNSGIVSTTSGGYVKSVSITWNSSTTQTRTVDIYASNTAYTGTADLYGDNKGTLVGSVTSTYGNQTITITDDYKYIGIRSNANALYLNEVAIAWVENGQGGNTDPDPVVETVATPTFSPASGEYEAGTEITIACATEGAAIYYTINGGAEQTYSAPIALTEAATISAEAKKEGWNNSEAATAAYTVKSTEPVTPPTGDAFYTWTHVKDATASSYTGNPSGTYDGIQWTLGANLANDEGAYVGGKSLTNIDRKFTSKTPMGSAISRIVIYHEKVSNANLVLNSVSVKAATTEEGLTSATATTTTTFDVSAAGQIEITGNWPNNAYYEIAFNLTNNASSNYRLPISKIEFYAGEGSDEPVVETVATPVIAPNGGEVESGSTVTITCATEGATIYYTINSGAEQTYSAPIALTEAATIVAVARKEGMNQSAEATASFTIKANDPVTPPTPGNGINAQWVASEKGYENGTAVESFTVGEVNFTLAKGTNSNNAPKYYNSGTAVRFYQGNTISVSANLGYVITKVEFVCVSGKPVAAKNLTAGAISDNVWTGEAAEFSFTHDAGSNDQMHVTGVNVTYKPLDADFVAAPTIAKVEDNVYKISHNDQEVALYYGLNLAEGVEPKSVIENGGTIEISADAVISAIAVKGENKSSVKTLAATYVAPKEAYTTWAGVKALELTSKDTPVELNIEATVTAVSANGKNIYVVDRTGDWMLLYLSTAQNELKNGDTFVLDGEFNAVLYNGAPEVKVTETIEDVEAGTAVAPTVVTLAELTAADANRYVKVVDVAYTDGNFVSGETTVAAYKNTFNPEGFDTDYDLCDVVAVVSIYKSAVQLSVISFENIREAEPTVYPDCGDVQFATKDGKVEISAENAVWFAITIAPDNGEVTTIEHAEATDGAYALTLSSSATLTVVAYNGNDKAGETAEIHIVAKEGQAGWNRVKSAADLTVGAKYVIIAKNGKVAAASTAKNPGFGPDATIVGDVATFAEEEALILTLEQSGDNYGFKLASGKYLTATNSGTDLNVTGSSISGNVVVSVSFDADKGTMIQFGSSPTRMILARDTYGFRYYGTNSYNAEGYYMVDLYKYEAVVPGGAVISDVEVSALSQLADVAADETVTVTTEVTAIFGWTTATGYEALVTDGTTNYIVSYPNDGANYLPNQGEHIAMLTGKVTSGVLAAESIDTYGSSEVEFESYNHIDKLCDAAADMPLMHFTLNNVMFDPEDDNDLRHMFDTESFSVNGRAGIDLAEGLDIEDGNLAIGRVSGFVVATSNGYEIVPISYQAVTDEPLPDFVTINLKHKNENGAELFWFEDGNGNDLAGSNVVIFYTKEGAALNPSAAVADDATQSYVMDVSIWNWARNNVEDFAANDELSYSHYLTRDSYMAQTFVYNGPFYYQPFSFDGEEQEIEAKINFCAAPHPTTNESKIQLDDDHSATLTNGLPAAEVDDLETLAAAKEAYGKAQANTPAKVAAKVPVFVGKKLPLAAAKTPVLGSITTGVANITLEAPAAAVRYYDMQGRRVDATNLTPGLYIEQRGAVARKIVIR